MVQKITIVVCENLKHETCVLQAQKAGGPHEFEMICFPSRCGCPELTWNELEERIGGSDSVNSEFHILGSCCVAELSHPPSRLSNCTVHHRKQCFYLFSTSSYIDSLLLNGSYLTTPGWLNQWPAHLEKLGFYKQDEAREFFRQSAKNITLLDTLIHREALSQVEAFSDFVGLPFERIPVGLELYALLLDGIVTKSAVRAITAAGNAEKQRAADCMMAMDIMAGLSRLHEERDILKTVLELFTILFSPQDIQFFPLEYKGDTSLLVDDSLCHYPIPWEKIHNEGFAMMGPDNKGFWLLLQSDNVHIGLIQVSTVAFPQYIRLYLNLALPIARLCGLVIRNARAENELRGAQKMEAIGTMAGGIAHNFNNILAGVVGYTDMALEEIPESSESHYYLNNILTAANRARDLVSQIVLFSQQKTADFGSSSPAALLLNFLDTIRSETASNCVIEHRIEPDIGNISLDRKSFESILDKITSNAFDAMVKSGGVVRIALERIELEKKELFGAGMIGPGQFMKMTVSDSGCGISTENMSRIFDPFFSTKGVGKGDGIGLSVVRGILTRHGGMIKAESKIGKGSTFTVYLPSAL